MSLNGVNPQVSDCFRSVAHMAVAGHCYGWPTVPPIGRIQKALPGFFIFRTIMSLLQIKTMMRVTFILTSFLHFTFSLTRVQYEFIHHMVFLLDSFVPLKQLTDT